MIRLGGCLIAVLLLVSCQSEPPSDATTTVPATSAPTVTVTPSTAPTTTTAHAEVESAVYLFFEGYPVAPGPYLVAVARPVGDDLEATLAALLEGATPAEQATGLSSTIPEGTRLLDAEISDGVASVDLSHEFETGGGSLSMMGRVAQIVYTATNLEGIDAVTFLLDGVPLDVLGGEGLIIDEPQTRSAWTELIPPILLETPFWGSAVGAEIVISGWADLESGTTSYVIVDSDGTIVQEGEIASSPGQRSDFDLSVELEQIPSPGRGSIIVWEWAPDGSQRHVLEYPIDLVDVP